MNRAFYIVGIVFSVVFLFITSYYSSEVSSARFDYLWSDYSYSSYGYDSYASDRYKDLTSEAALWSLFFFLFFIAMDLLGLIKVKTTTTKVFSIIGLSISGIFLFWNLGMLASSGGITFDEVSPGWGFYCLMMIAFSIIGLVQSVRFAKGRTKNTTTVGAKETKDLLDS